MVGKAKISVIGLGYVGLPLAILAVKNGHDVTGIDLDLQKIQAVNKGIDPISDKYVARYLASSKLKAVSSFESVGQNSIILVCVPTPVKNELQPDLGPLKKAVSSLAAHLKPKSLIIIESTVNPGVCDEILIPLIQKISGLKVTKDFDIAHCPERINPGDKKWNIENIPRVAGASSPRALRSVIKFYSSIIKAPIRPMGSLKEAEAVKIVENSFRDVNIAFVNELAVSFSRLGINVKNVIEGAATKPFAFMPHYPSIGVGGHCIPVDPYYLIEYAKGYGFDHEFLSLARAINNRMPEFVVEQLIEGLSEAGIKLEDTTVAILGLSYKANVSDDRESPSYKVIKILESKAVSVKTYDPHLLHKSSAKSIDEALKNTEAVILATDHAEFTDLPKSKHLFKVFVDGKNTFSKSDFANDVIYKGIGT